MGVTGRFDRCIQIGNNGAVAQAFRPFATEYYAVGTLISGKFHLCGARIFLIRDSRIQTG